MPAEAKAKAAAPVKPPAPPKPLKVIDHDHELVAARFTFRRLFLAGLTALIADAVGFAVLLVINIQVIRELAIAASIGVAALIFTNLILLPILLSYTGVSAKAAERSLRSETADAMGAEKHAIWHFLDRFTDLFGRASCVRAIDRYAGAFFESAAITGPVSPVPNI